MTARCKEDCRTESDFAPRAEIDLDNHRIFSPECLIYAIKDEYANTIANRANCLWNLPDQPEHAEFGNRANLALAQAAYLEARAIFMEHGELDKARIVAEAVDQIGREILSLAPTNGEARAS